MEELALAGILTLWATMGFLAWAGAVVLRRRRYPLLALPFCLIAAMGAGGLVPAIGGKGWPGFWLSIPMSLLGGMLGAVVWVTASQNRS